jgi:hypothetical protein
LSRALIAFLTVGALGVFAALAAATVTGPFPVKFEAGNQQNPAASADGFAWTHAPADHPNRTHVRVEETPINGEDDIRVNPVGTRAWTGGIDGNTLVYQEFDDGNSDIRLANLSAFPTVTRSDPPPGINTARWEWHPTISMDTTGETWILFGRQNVATGAQHVIAFNETDQLSRVLASTDRRRYALYPGQVNGDWATWTSCKPNCNVFYVNLVDGPSVVKVPRPSRVAHQYASSVTEDGTVYFVKSGRGCGTNVGIGRFDADATKPRQIIHPFSDHRDVFFTHVSQEPDGAHIFYDRVNCGSGAWNILQLVDDGL